MPEIGSKTAGHDILSEPAAKYLSAFVVAFGTHAHKEEGWVLTAGTAASWNSSAGRCELERETRQNGRQVNVAGFRRTTGLPARNAKEPQTGAD